MPSLVRLTDPLPLASLAPSMRSLLPNLTTPGGKFSGWLGSPGRTLCIVALGSSGLLGWAVANPDEQTIGVFVLLWVCWCGIGNRLMDALCAAVRERWPEIEWSTSTAPGSAGRRFMAEHDRRVRRAS